MQFSKRQCLATGFGAILMLLGGCSASAGNTHLSGHDLRSDSAVWSGAPVPPTFQIGFKSGDPFEYLPNGARFISVFGERPVFSPDGQHVAFMGKTFGDAFEYDLRSGEIRNLTSHFPHIGFTRVHYLPDGSYILIGPRTMGASVEETRTGRLELFWMDAEGRKPAVPLGQTIFEGIAVSRSENRISWATIEPRGRSPLNVQTEGGDGSSTVHVADLRIVAGRASLENIKTIASSRWADCALEPQDFLPDNETVVAPCYNITKPEISAVVLLKDGDTTRIPMPDNLYGEVEGVFPDGRRALVECGNHPSQGLDLCLLELGGSYRYSRLTHVQDYGPYRFSNPTVSGDGRLVGFQYGLASDPFGTGRGILLMQLPAGF